jgi:sigma-B regulation protein RsbU (phosphoserine phosphatase)
MRAHQAPCFEVGGDLYDVMQCPDGRVILVLGDVTGKGMAAALLMANVLASLRTLYPECLDPSTLVKRLHEQVLESSDEVHYVTLFLGLLEPTSHRLDYVNAGHNPPLLIDAEGNVSTLDSTGLPAGMMPGASYEIGSIELSPGGLLCVYSDAFPEAQVGEEFYDEERFFESVRQRRSLPLEGLIGGVLDDLRAFLSDTPLGDDATLLLVRRLPSRK